MTTGFAFEINNGLGEIATSSLLPAKLAPPIVVTASPVPASSSSGGWLSNLVNNISNLATKAAPVVSTTQQVISTVKTAKSGGTVTVPGTQLTYTNSQVMTQPVSSTSFKLSTPAKFGIGIAVAALVTTAGVLIAKNRKKKKS